MALPPNFDRNCSTLIADYPQILMAHGGGGRLMHELLEKMILPAFGNSMLYARHDGALLDFGEEASGRRTRLAFTTDSYVVSPLFFPGGDLGALAVYGTVNDLAMCGARPLYLSVGFIIEEGLLMETLGRVIRSMQVAAGRANVQIITGDTKVVDKGKGDGLFINTAGIGAVASEQAIAPASLETGDVILLNGDVGRHGMAIMAAREGLAFENVIESDCDCVADLVLALLAAGVRVHCLRDLTRGGLATALNEIAETARLAMALVESAIPIREDVRGACEILGFDPLYVACEGRFVAFVPPQDAERALAIMRSHPLGAMACDVGRVTGPSSHGLVTLKTQIGGYRIVDMLSGEQLPRIC
ncbi:MAG: hydrogenase expression/formation protein HypE [Acidobacteria bacterium]|nr:hydrogenase expression/formation protein HypE [Acidobacteriota bacterium]MBI3655207.1 hydrogenase expression/formation protein HypE [Acidobacteriota bacterium]